MHFFGTFCSLNHLMDSCIRCGSNIAFNKRVSLDRYGKMAPIAIIKSDSGHTKITFFLVSISIIDKIMGSTTRRRIFQQI